MNEEMTGLTMDAGIPPCPGECSCPEDAAGTDAGADCGFTAEEEKKRKTKSVSDRINAVRAESETEIRSLRERLTEAEAELARFYEGAEDARPIGRDVVLNDPEFRMLRQRELERQKDDMLKSLKEAFPNDSIEDIDSFDEQFYRMLLSGVEPVKAYAVCVAGERKSAPPSAGSVKEHGGGAPGYYTEEQVRSMSANEITKHYDDIMKSMRKWKK